MKQILTGIIMGSDSDLEVMKEAAIVLEEFGVGYELTIVSAHRTPMRMVEYAQQAGRRGLDVIIAGAGGAAHLPGMVASITELPVIGVPIRSSHLQGLDSMLSIVQMPGGVPVAAVAINQSKNAGLLAVSILGLKYPEYREAYRLYKQRMEQEVISKAQELERAGYKNYIKEMKKEKIQG